MSWVETLPLELLGIRNAFKEDIQVSTAELVSGKSLRLPGKMLTPALTQLNRQVRWT